jgi:hypothetical protein
MEKRLEVLPNTLTLSVEGRKGGFHLGDLREELVSRLCHGRRQGKSGAGST